MKKAAFLIASMLATVAPIAARAEPVLLISIDGLRPGDVAQAEKRGLRIPNLRRFLKDGAYATGVVGVLPTLTYPSHTTLMTGVAPAVHGIVNNNSFDPMQVNYGGWYWYASDVKVPMLWEAASRAGLSTGNIHWPVSVGAKDVTWNLPQIWRSGHADDAKLIDALATRGLMAELEKATATPYAAGIDESITADENRGRFASALIGAHKPDFLTVYLAALDHEEHMQGPDTAQAHTVLERIDAIVGALVAAERKVHPDAVIAVVSDHGFEATTSETNLYRAFIDAGLIRLDKDGKIASWDATPWTSGGSAAIVLADPKDPALLTRVKAVLDGLRADAANHIAAIIPADEIARMGGNPQASFYVNMTPNAITGIFKGADAPLSGPTPIKGMHGYFPAAANLRSTFMLMGQDIPAGLSLGEVDMRAIAPTLARIMGASLPDAQVAPVELKRRAGK